MLYNDRPTVLSVRPARPDDIPALVRLAEQLADYQDLGDRFAATEDGIRAGLFGRHRAAEAIVAEREKAVVGYAIYALSFSSTRGAPKLIVEDIFVTPGCRGEGVGFALVRAIAHRAKELGVAYAQWSVLRDNTTARRFYDNIGAGTSPEWMTCTLEGESLSDLAQGLSKTSKVSRKDRTHRARFSGSQAPAECE